MSIVPNGIDTNALITLLAVSLGAQIMVAVYSVVGAIDALLAWKRGVSR